MLVYLDATENIYFIYSTLLEFFVLAESGDRNNFDCIFFLIDTVDSSIDFAVDSWANNLVEGIIFDVFDHMFLNSDSKMGWNIISIISHYMVIIFIFVLWVLNMFII
jgi:hypothetical protein